MRILLVAGFFPPYAPMSGVRAGKLAKYLLARGHDVRVLAARDLPFPGTVPLEIPAARVTYTHWHDVNAAPRALARAVRRRAPAADQESGGGDGRPGLARRLADVYQALTNWPDGLIGWLGPATRAGRRLLADWRPDLVYASSRPVTGVLVAARLASRARIPWAAEFRDLWTDDPYWPPPKWRLALERIQERRLLARAAGLVTVSAPWVETLRAHGRPTALVMNGFDADDFPAEPVPPPLDDQCLTILYAGSIYAGYRDPSPLFQALRTLDAARFRVVFFGDALSEVPALARAHGVERMVAVHPPVPYRDAVSYQRRADVLLHLQWNDPREDGVIPGKLFEYAGARRPVLGIGYTDGAAARLMAEHGLGPMANEPAEIAGHLERWRAAKDAGAGVIPPLPLAARAGLSRQEQFARLERFLEGLLAPPQRRR